MYLPEPTFRNKGIMKCGTKRTLECMYVYLKLEDSWKSENLVR